MIKYIALLAALTLAACGGGGEDALTEADGTCAAESVHEVNRLIAAHGPLQCRKWIVNGTHVDGAPYPDFLIGD